MNKPTKVIIVTVFIGLLVGYDHSVGYALSLSRTIVFFPFFLVGYYFDRKYIDRLTQPASKMFAIVILLMVLTITYIKPHLINRTLFLGAVSYDASGITEWYAGIYRLFQYLISTTVMFCVIALVPKTRNVFSYIGTRTDSVYLLHGFVYYFLMHIGLYNHLKSYGKLGILGVIGISAVVTLVLSTKVVSAAMHPSKLINRQLSQREHRSHQQ